MDNPRVKKVKKMSEFLVDATALDMERLKL